MVVAYSFTPTSSSIPWLSLDFQPSLGHPTATRSVRNHGTLAYSSTRWSSLDPRPRRRPTTRAGIPGPSWSSASTSTMSWLSLACQRPSEAVLGSQPSQDPSSDPAGIDRDTSDSSRRYYFILGRGGATSTTFQPPLKEEPIDRARLDGQAGAGGPVAGDQLSLRDSWTPGHGNAGDADGVCVVPPTRASGGCVEWNTCRMGRIIYCDHRPAHLRVTERNVCT
jgi:hypothetical protein